MSKKYLDEFKKDLEKNLEFDSKKIDTSKLESNEELYEHTTKSKPKLGFLIPVCCGVLGMILIIPVAVGYLNMSKGGKAGGNSTGREKFSRPSSAGDNTLPKDSNSDENIGSNSKEDSTSVRYKTVIEIDKKAYSDNEINIATSNSFKKINDISAPQRTYNSFSNEEIEKYIEFTYKTYSAIERTKNFGYSPITYFSLLNQLSLANSNSNLTDKFDSLLGNETQRTNFYKKVYTNNYYAFDYGTTKMHNGAFLTNKYLPNSTFVEKLTNLYTDCYTLDFSRNDDVNKMIEWVNTAVQDSNFMSKDYLDINSNSCFYLFSSLYFKHNWYETYYESDTKESDFYLANGQIKKEKFMSHKYFTDKYYDYGRYVSFEDRYYYGNKVVYIVPKNENDNIYDLLNGVNFLKEDNAKEISDNKIMVRLTAPKFNFDSSLDMKDSFKALGFEDAFNSQIASFNNAFQNLTPSQASVFLKVLKQKNSVGFNEDGITIKNVAIAGAETSGMMPNPDSSSNQYRTLNINLNQPFVYIIKDNAGLPLFVGTFDGN